MLPLLGAGVNAAPRDLAGCFTYRPTSLAALVCCYSRKHNDYDVNMLGHRCH